MCFKTTNSNNIIILCSDINGNCENNLQNCYNCPINYCFSSKIPGACSSIDYLLRCRSFE